MRRPRPAAQPDGLSSVWSVCSVEVTDAVSQSASRGEEGSAPPTSCCIISCDLSSWQYQASACTTTNTAVAIVIKIAGLNTTVGFCSLTLRYLLESY